MSLESAYKKTTDMYVQCAFIADELRQDPRADDMIGAFKKIELELAVMVDMMHARGADRN